MAFTGGDIVQISYNHPLGSGILAPKANEDNEYDIGGVRSNDDETGVASTGEGIYSMTMKRWSAKAVVASDMNIRQEYDKMCLIAASIDEAVFSFLHINGTVYKGKGKPVGDLKLNVNQSTFSLNIQGGGQLQQ